MLKSILVGIALILMSVAVLAQIRETKIPSDLTKKQGEYFLNLRDLMSDADNHFAGLSRGAGGRTNKPDGSIDVPVRPLSAALQGFDYGWVTDPSRNDSFLYFEGTPYEPGAVFEDYKQAIRALFPERHEEPFEPSHWRMIQGKFLIDLRRDREHLNLRPENPFERITLSISRQS